MNSQKQVVIFGEVLFDCFASGEEILGGAPFNVAWHLQALGDNPKLISRVGHDQQGQTILNAMSTWGMDIQHVQTDLKHPTGRVEVTVIDNEPHYDIVSNVAYDFIEQVTDKNFHDNGILYHGSLALRNEQSNAAFDALCQQYNLPIFVDVNLRSPWWTKQNVDKWLHTARWAKLNLDELRILGFNDSDTELAIRQLQTEFKLEQAIITRGERGTVVCTAQHDFHQISPPNVTQFVDTVGAGDAFTARYIHGLVSGEDISITIDAAQKFAIKVIGLRGATSSDPAFYQD